MKLLVSQMIEGETAFHFVSDKDGWVREVLHRVEKRGYHVLETMRLDVKLTKFEPDYYLRGQLQFDIEQTCARCADNFKMPVQHRFDVALAHVSVPKVNRFALSEESDVNFFEGNEIDLAPLVEEQFFLSIPYQAFCNPGCKGMCQKCGQNLNGGACDCLKANPLTPFSVLQEYKC